MEMKGNGHKSNWLVVVKGHLADIKGPGWVDENLATIDGIVDAIKAVTDNLPNSGALNDLATNKGHLEHATYGLSALQTLLAAIAAYVDTEVAAIKAVTDNLPDSGALTTIQADLDNPTQYKADVSALALEATLTAIKGGGWTNETLKAIKDAVDLIDTSGLALEATLTAIKGGGWTNETLKAIKDAIDAIAGVDTYQEQIPDTDFSLAAIDDTLTSDPPNADAENSVVDIDQAAGETFALRSLWVNVTSLGTGGTKLTFELWVPLNAVVTKVDSVDVAATGIQNLTDLFGLQEVHADGIWITVITDSVSADAACEGTYRSAKAS